MPIQNLIDNNILLSIESGSLITHLNDGQSDNDRSRLVFEFYVYDIDTNELLDKSIIKVLDEWNRSIFISSDKLLLNPGMHLRSLGYSAGVYKIRYKFFKNLVGEHDGEKLHLKRISPSRNELELIPPEDINLIIEGTVKLLGGILLVLLGFGVYGAIISIVLSVLPVSQTKSSST